MDKDENVSSSSFDTEQIANPSSAEPSKDNASSETKHSHKKTIIIALIVLLIIVVGGVIFLIVNNGAKKEEVSVEASTSEEETVKQPEKEEKEKEEKEEEEEQAERVAKTAILPKGTVLNKKLYTIAGNKAGERGEINYNVTAIKRAKELPEDKKSRDYDITDNDSDMPVYLWYEKNMRTVYFYSDAKIIYADEDFESAFEFMEALSDISGLAEIDVSRVKNMRGLFFNDKNIKSIQALEGWDTSNVELANNLFFGNTKLTNISALRKWNTSKIKDSGDMFSGCENLSDISALSGWKTKSLTITSGMFYGMSKLENISALENWDMSNVYHASSMFGNDELLKDLSPIAKWNVGKLEYATGLFIGTGVEDATVLNSWNTSSLKFEGDMFDSGVKVPKWYQSFKQS